MKQSIFFTITDSIDGEIIHRIHKNTGLMPSEIIRRKYTPDFRFLWRTYFKEIEREIELLEIQAKMGGLF